MKRAHSIGVSVKETSSDTAIANAAVKPKDAMKRPTMPPMKPTGRKTASSDKRGRHHGQTDLLGAFDRRLQRASCLSLR